MRMRAVALLIENDRVALIERHRPGRHYFTFPGGGVGRGETLEQTVVREMKEETGLLVIVIKLIAEVWYKGNQQFYFLARAEDGIFGTGDGEEYTNPRPDDLDVGTYRPLWMPVSEIRSKPVLPQEIARIVVKAHRDGWPEQPVVIFEE